MKFSNIPIISIVIVNWNTKKYLLECLKSVYSHLRNDLIEVIVVDNASSDGSSEMVVEHFPQSILINNSQNVGFSIANNQAINASHGRYILFLNSDTLVQNDFIKEIDSFMSNRPTAGIVGLKHIYPQGGTQPSTAPSPNLLLEAINALRINLILPRKINGNIFFGQFWDHDTTKKVGRVSGAAMVVRRDAIDKMGPFADDFFMYSEDDEICYRFIKGGWEVWFLSSVEIIHAGGASTSSVWSRLDKNIRMLEGKYLLLSKHFNKFKVNLFLATMLLERLASLIKTCFVYGNERVQLRQLKTAESKWIIDKLYQVIKTHRHMPS